MKNISRFGIYELRAKIVRAKMLEVAKFIGIKNPEKLNNLQLREAIQ